MNKNEVQELFRKYNTGSATTEERTLLEQWYSKASLESQRQPADEDLLSLKHEAWVEIYSQTVPKRSIRLWPQLRAAVGIAAVLVALMGVWTFFKEDAHQDISGEIVYKGINPGTQGATLTLAGGRKIHLNKLSDGQVASQEGALISKSKAGQLIYQAKGGSNGINDVNILTTAMGEMYQVVLPDGSKVWLNAASSLTYPVNFATKKERRVRLTGEGYFEISKDAAHPFIVESRGQLTQVLGTHFSVSAYEDEEQVKTILAEGSVKVSSVANSSQTVQLVPGELSVFQQEHLTKAAADLNAELSWVRGDFIFNDEPLESVMRKVSRWYGVQVIYGDQLPPSVRIGGFLSRSRPISDVLERIEKAAHLKFTVSGKTIYVNHH